MLIKSADDKTSDIEMLKSLAARPDASAEVRKKIEQEIRNIQAGLRGENEAAYEIDFHHKSSENWAVIHDLRLEYQGRVAQIDHLIINRFLEMWLCESKHFSEGVGVNEQGEFSAFYAGKPYGVPSPLEQNKKHATVLEAVLKSGLVELPNRLGFTITPKINTLVLISKKARISRPKVHVAGLDTIIKNDQIRTQLEKSMDYNPLTIGKVIGSDSLKRLASRIASLHRPIVFDWAARFGLQNISAPDSAPQALVPESTKDTDTPQKSKLICASCDVNVPYNVAKFCWFNKTRFGGKVYCMECQKKFQANTTGNQLPS